MTRPDAVLHFSSLQWPSGALGRRPLLVFEPYDASVFSLEEGAPDNPEASLLARGFERSGLTGGRSLTSAATCSRCLRSSTNWL